MVFEIITMKKASNEPMATITVMSFSLCSVNIHEWYLIRFSESECSRGLWSISEDFIDEGTQTDTTFIKRRCRDQPSCIHWVSPDGPYQWVQIPEVLSLHLAKMSLIPIPVLLTHLVTEMGGSCVRTSPQPIRSCLRGTSMGNAIGLVVLQDPEYL